MFMKAKNIFLTGRPRVGKTTLLKFFAEQLGARAGGFYTEEILGEGIRGRSGFRLITLEGKEGILAEVDVPSRYQVGRYGIHLDVMEELAVPAIKKAIIEKEWILIDEIGKMEEGSAAFKQILIEALNSPKQVLATIRWHDSEFTKMIKNRQDVELIKLTVPNREFVYRKIHSLILSSA